MYVLSVDGMGAQKKIVSLEVCIRLFISSNTHGILHIYPWSTHSLADPGSGLVGGGRGIRIFRLFFIYLAVLKLQI